MRKEDFNNNKDTEEKIPLNKKTLTFIFAIITFTVLLNWTVNHAATFSDVVKSVGNLLSPFFIGACIAFIINTVLRPVEKLWDKVPKKKRTKMFDKAKRPVCLAFSALVVFGVVFAVLFMVIPQLAETVSSFANMLPTYITNLNSLIDKFYAFFERYNIVIPEIDFNWKKAGELLNKLLDNYADSFINTTVEFTTSIITVVVNFIIAIFFSLYILAKKERLSKHASRVLYATFAKEKAEKFIEFSKLTSDTFTKFVTGQLLEAVIIGVLCFIGLLILRMPYPAVISILIGFTALIPVFGALFGTTIGAILILLVDPMKALWFVVFIIVLQQLETNLIYPKVVGKTVGLPGILVLFSVTVGGGMFGIIGMLFAVPVCTVLYCVYKEFISKKLKDKEIPETLK